MKKGLFFTICLCIAVLGSAAYLLCSLSMFKNSKVVENGVYSVPDMEEEPNLDILLSGEWEYYPDTLLVSGDEIRSLPGQVLNSRKKRALYGDNIKTDYVSTTASNELAQYRSPGMESAFSDLFRTQPFRASYRLVLKDCYLFRTGDPLFMSFLGNVEGNYRVFINGNLKGVRMQTPNGWPNYLMDKSVSEDGVDENIPENEIIIEVTGASGRLNITPRIMTVATSMDYYDIQKNITMVVTSVFIAIFLVLLFSIRSSKFSDLLPYFLIGILSTLFYIFSVFWNTGFVDTLTGWLPNVLFTQIPLILAAVCLGILFYTVFRAEGPKISKKQYVWCFVLIALSVLLQLASCVFAVPGILRALGLLLFFVLQALWIVSVYRRLGRLTRDQLLLYAGVLIVFGGFAIAGIIQLNGSSKWMNFVLPGCLVFYLVLLFYVLAEKRRLQLQRLRELLALEKEATKMQTALYSSQINPHFLYNTLMTIQEMCYTEPSQAAHLIVRFSNYLRNNIDFMESSDIIPFEDELSHIDTYIYVQKARFNDKLTYIQNIEEKDFLLPPLSVQPLIENAVKYGVRATDEGGTVTLHTFKEKEQIHIVVEDDGPGLNPDGLTEEHSLNNIRKRLEILVHGTLTISSKEPSGRGVRVEIIIPEQ